MDLALVIKHKLKELALEQRDLATAAHVTESYISQLLAGKKIPPAPGRTGVYSRIEACLGLAPGEISELALLQRKEHLKKRIAGPPRPMFRAFRELTLRKCQPAAVRRVRAIFEKEPFGELERLVTQKLLDVTKNAARGQLDDERWLRAVARLGRRSHEQMRVMIVELLEVDVFHVSVDNCAAYIDPLIESWDIDLETFSMEVALNPRLASGARKRFEFVESEPHRPFPIEPGFEEFLRDSRLSASATEEEIEYLKRLPVNGRRPTPLYYYREMQNLRDPLHFGV